MCLVAAVTSIFWHMVGSIFDVWKYSGISINGQLYTTDISKQRTNMYIPKYCMMKPLKMTPSYSRHLSTTDNKIGLTGVCHVWVPLYLKSLKVSCFGHNISDLPCLIVGRVGPRGHARRRRFARTGTCCRTF